MVKVGCMQKGEEIKKTITNLRGASRSFLAKAASVSEKVKDVAHKARQMVEGVKDEINRQALMAVDEAEKHQALLVAIEVASMLKDDRFEIKLIALAESDQNLKVRNAAIKTLETSYDKIL